MRPHARASFLPFTSALEGVVPWMYLDVRGLVTIAIGNLIDPIEAALRLPLVYAGTEIPAPRKAIEREWHRVKDHPTAAQKGHGMLANETSLRLTDAGIRQVVGERLNANEALLRQQYPDIDSWPAAAQLATHSMAWACGAYFGGSHAGGFPRLAAALRSRAWRTAATECVMSSKGNPGLIPRNAANKALYLATADLTRNEDVVPWEILTAIDPRLWPASSAPTQPAPANDNAPVRIDGGTVTQIPLPDRPERDPDDAA